MNIDIDDKSWGNFQPKVKSDAKHKSIGEMSELEKMMQEDPTKYQQMFGIAEMADIKGMVTSEKKLFSTRDRLKLGAKMKKMIPECDNCQLYQYDPKDPDKKHCDPHSINRNITFGAGEVLNDLPVEVCEKFKFKKV